VQGTPLRNIAAQFDVSTTALQRHKAHVSQALLEAANNSDELSASKLLKDLANLQAKALSILAKAEKSGDLRICLQAIREAREVIATCARILEVNEVEARIQALEAHMRGETR